LARLIEQQGSLVAAARAFARRHGKNEETVQRRFNRLQAGQIHLFNESLRDELEVML
jgi:hypothetical protein